MPRSSRSFLFPDVNVWVSLTWAGHIHHSAAREWFEALDDAAGIAFCRFTQISLLRLLTTRAVMGDDVMTQSQAWGAYDHWMGDDRVLFLQEPANLEPAFRGLSRRPHSDPKIWADAYLAAFSMIEGMQFVTFDRGFEGRVDQLIVLKP